MKDNLGNSVYFLGLCRGLNITKDPNVPCQYKSDSLWNYEAGVKGNFLDKRVTLSAALYQINWADMQNRVFVNGAGFNGNAGKAHSCGLELNVEARPLDSVSLSLSGAFMDAALDENAPENPDFPTGIEGGKGDCLLGVPKVTLSAGAQYHFPVSDLITGVLRADVSHVGSSYTQYRAVAPADPSPQTELGTYNFTNIRGTLRASKWEMTAYINNLFDVRPTLDVYKFLGQPTLTTTSRPRTVGGCAQYIFDWIFRY